VTRALAGLGLALALAGCASWSWPGSPSAALLDEADRLAREGQWSRAVAAYDEYLARYPDSGAARRALESRDTLAATLTARGELTRLREEVMHLREELARREVDLVRVRQEAERLRSDLEKLKQIDLKLERSR
jgi:hypothetical protein